MMERGMLIVLLVISLFLRIGTAWADVPVGVHTGYNPSVDSLLSNTYTFATLPTTISNPWLTKGGSQGSRITCQDCTPTNPPIAAGLTLTKPTVCQWDQPNAHWNCAIKTFDVTDFGAKCDAAQGVDVSTNIQTAMDTAAGMVLYFPPCPLNKGYNIGPATVVTYSIHTQGPIFIYGDGTNIYVNNATGGMQFSDFPTFLVNALIVNGLNFYSVYAGSSPGYGLDLQGIVAAHFSWDQINSVGATNPFAIGVHLEAAQQNIFTGLRLRGNTVNLQLDDMTLVAPTGANQNHFTQLYTGTSTRGVLLLGGASTNTFETMSCQVNTICFVNNQTSGTGGFAQNVIRDSEIEANTQYGIDVVQGGVQVYSTYISSPSITDDIITTANGWLTVNGCILNNNSLINGIPAGQRDWIYDNIINGTFTINVAAIPQVSTFDNRGSGAPADQLVAIQSAPTYVGSLTPSIAGGGGLGLGSNSFAGSVNTSAAAGNVITPGFTCPTKVICMLEDETTLGGARITANTQTTCTYSATIGDIVDYIASCR